MGNNQIKTSEYRTEALEKLRSEIETRTVQLSQKTNELIQEKDKLNVNLERIAAIWKLQNEASVVCNPLKTAFSSTAKNECLKCKNDLTHETLRFFQDAVTDVHMSEQIETMEKFRERIQSIEINK